MVEPAERVGRYLRTQCDIVDIVLSPPLYLSLSLSTRVHSKVVGVELATKPGNDTYVLSSLVM